MSKKNIFKKFIDDLREKELESVAGGFIFAKPGHWLDKTEIRCPNCGCSSYNKIDCTLATANKVEFFCKECNTKFERKQ